MRVCSLSCENKLCVVTAIGVLQKPRLYISVYHGGYPSICDSCDLQPDCHEVFGERGRNCPAHGLGERWMSVPDGLQEGLKAVLT